MSSSSERDFRDYLRDIVRSIELIEQFTNGMNLADFISDDKTVYAVIRCLEIIGEAVKRLPAEFKESNLNVPWKIMAGMRDRLIHGYDVVDPLIVWNTVKKDIPSIKPELSRLNDSFL